MEFTEYALECIRISAFFSMKPKNLGSKKYYFISYFPWALIVKEIWVSSSRA